MDEYYHEDEHEPLMNEPHGYLFAEDVCEPDFHFKQKALRP